MDYKEKILAWINQHEYASGEEQLSAVSAFDLRIIINTLPSEKEIAKRLYTKFMAQYFLPVRGNVDFRDWLDKEEG